MLNPINKHSVLKQVRKSGTVKVFIAPNKVNEYHVANGWHIGTEIDIYLVHGENDTKEYHVFWNKDGIPTATPLEKYLEQYIIYNGNSSLGRRVKFWA